MTQSTFTEKTQTKLVEHSEFSKAFMRWCLGSGFMLAGLLLVILVVYVWSPSPLIMNWDYGRGAGHAYLATIPLLLSAIYLFIISTILALIAVLKYRKGKTGWISYSLIVLTFVLSSFAFLFLMMLEGLANWHYVIIYFNVSFLYCMFFIMSASFIWFLVWMILLYRKGRMKYWSFKAFLCRWTGFVMAIAPIVLLVAIRGL